MREHRVAGNDGVATFVIEYSAMGAETGSPIICLHGLTRNHKDFRDIIDPLRRMGRKVIALDVRGRGLSDRDPNPSNYNPMIYVQDLMGILAKLEVPRAVFIGTSMGGLMIMILASFAPHMIAGAVLNDIGPEVDPAGLKRIQGYVGVPRPKAKTWEEAGMMLSLVGASTFPGRDQAFWIDFAQRNGLETPDGIVFDYDPAIAQVAGAPSDGPLPTMWDQFAAFKDIPTAVIRGALSDLLSTDTVDRMKLAKPDLVTAEVPRVGHAPMLSEPEAWRAIEAIVRVAN
jgi:pimeloyl-ACP methyl ester carboxylesterase